MICPKCNSLTAVTDSRPMVSGGVRRRRECLQCGHRFSTLETQEQFHAMEQRKDCLAALNYVASVIQGEVRKMQDKEDR